MVNRDLCRTVVGIIGNVISCIMFLSPIPTFAKIIKMKSVQDFKPDPYLATILNCALWVFYGMPFVHPDSLLVLTINGFGCVLELIYVLIFLIFSDWPKRRKMIIALVIEFIFYGIVVSVTFQFIHGTHARTIFVGAFCVALNVIMYASPLTVMRMVIKTKSVKFMPFYLSLANFANGVCWLAYATIKFDPWVAVPNGLGALLGGLQLIIYAMYYKSSEAQKREEERRKAEIELTEQQQQVQDIP